MKLVSQPRFWLLFGLLCADGLLFSLSDPHKTPSFMLMIGFLLFIASLYYVLLGLLTISSWYGLSKTVHHKRLARMFTGLLGGLVALQSIGQLSTRDIFVLLPLAVLAYLYISYSQTSKHAKA